MPRIKVFGWQEISEVIFDEGKDSDRFITRPETWASFLNNVPRRGPCKLFIGHPSANGDGKRINGKLLKDYSFPEVCWRVELELAPKTG